MSFEQTTPHIGQLSRRGVAIGIACAIGLSACGEQKAPEIEVDMSLPRAAAGTDFIDGYEKVENGWITGAKDAPVKVVEYGSFTCGGCAGFHYQVEPQIMEEFVKTGYVQFEFRSFVRNEPDMLATMVAECLGDTKFKGVKNLYFSSIQKWLNAPNPNDFVAEMARKAGVSSSAFRRCTSDTDLRETLGAATKDAQQKWSDSDGYFRTPTLIINGEKLQDGYEWERLSQSIERALRS